MSDFITRREQYLAYIAGESDTYPDEPITREETFLAEIALRIASGGTGGSGGVGILKIQKTSTNGLVDTYTITYTDNTKSTFTVTNGKDGLTPYIKDGNWWIGDTDTGVKAEGKDGINGKDGVNGIDGKDGADGEKGEKGDKGDKGDAGADGKDGTNGKDGANGTNGKDGVSATHSWNGTTLTITSASGTSSADLKGADGEDYVLTETDKSEIAARVVEMLGGNPIFGIVDENNNIILSGNLADGDYTVKYEMEDGSTVAIGNLVLDTNVYYSVTNNLTNCTNNNNITEVTEGESYSATISANSGYELKSVTVTMGGSSVTATNGVINIASVTGNIVITAIAEEAAVEITNWIEKVGYTENTRLSLSSGGTTTASGYECTDFIEAKYGDVLYIENVDLTDENATNITFYDKEKNPLSINSAGTQYGTKSYYFFVTNGTQTGGGYSGTIEAKGAIEYLPKDFDGYIRIGSKSITNTSVLNIKRGGVWM